MVYGEKLLKHSLMMEANVYFILEAREPEVTNVFFELHYVPKAFSATWFSYIFRFLMHRISSRNLEALKKLCEET
ncbi:MAG: hypothetical protein ACOCXH_13945 [Cyclobacteriaceae bacterium]